MSTASTNLRKFRERFLLERFTKAAKLEVQILEEREAPDFIVLINGTLVGVEITELFISHDRHGNTLQAQEAITSQIAAKAQRLYQASGGPPTHVTVCFGQGQDLRGLNRDRTAQILCDYVRGLNLSHWQKADWRPEGPDHQMPNEISFVHAIGVPSFDMAHWGVARAGWVAPLSTAPMQARINEKAKRLHRYQTAIKENWLILVADAMKPSSLLEAKADFDGQEIMSPFCRTFFYRHPDSVFEFGTAR